MSQLLPDLLTAGQQKDTAVIKHFSMAFSMGFRYFLHPGSCLVLTIGQPHAQPPNLDLRRQQGADEQGLRIRASL
jgi:hypothetical protein